MAQEFCACDRAAPEQPSGDAQSTADLNKRIREVTARIAAGKFVEHDVFMAELDAVIDLATPPPGWTRFCAICGRTHAVCAGRCE